MEKNPTNINSQALLVACRYLRSCQAANKQDVESHEVEDTQAVVACTPHRVESPRKAPLVVNVKVAHIRPQGYHDLSEWMKNPEHVYIGRVGAVFLDINGAKRRFPEKSSEWANPFTVKKYGDRCLELYEAWLRDKLEKDGIDELKKLKNKVLGCWCYPNKCHGDILKKYIVGLPDYSCSY